MADDEKFAVLELKDRLERAKARRAAAQLTDEELEHAKLLEQIAEEEAEARAVEAKARAVRSNGLEAEARKASQGRYLVKYFDLAALLPDADAAKLPGGGLLILRSPPPNAWSQFQREVEAKERGLIECYIDLVCASIVYPDMSGGAGMTFRDFLESSIGNGTVIPIGDAVGALGGARSKVAKRGRG